MRLLQDIHAVRFPNKTTSSVITSHPIDLLPVTLMIRKFALENCCTENSGKGASRHVVLCPECLHHLTLSPTLQKVLVYSLVHKIVLCSGFLQAVALRGPLLATNIAGSQRFHLLCTKGQGTTMASISSSAAS